ncbi:MAG: nucleotidyltransferase family protein [Planctomycetota bacterium]
MPPPALCHAADRTLEAGAAELIAAFRDAIEGRQRALPPAPLRGVVGRLARAHRISALLAGTYDPGAEGSDPFHAGLVEFYRGSAARNLFAQHVLGRALEALEGAGVRAIVLKGAVLGPVLYEDLALRPMSDMDMVVRPEDRERAGAALSGAGFVEMGFPAYRTDPAQGVQPVDSYAFYADSTRETIELHWDLARRYDPVNFLGDPIARAVSVEAGGRQIWTLDPTDTLHHLGIHLSDVGNRSQRLLWYADIALLLRRSGAQLDVDRLVHDAQAWGSRDGLTRVLSTLHHALGIELGPLLGPRGFLANETLAQPALAIALSVPHDRQLDKATEDATLLAAVLRTPGFAGKLRVVGGMVFVSPATMRRRYDIPEGAPLKLMFAYVRRAAAAAWRVLRALQGSRQGPP